jgi:hypothetical protein
MSSAIHIGFMKMNNARASVKKYKGQVLVMIFVNNEGTNTRSQVSYQVPSNSHPGVWCSIQ